MPVRCLCLACLYLGFDAWRGVERGEVSGLPSWRKQAKRGNHSVLVPSCSLAGAASWSSSCRCHPARRRPAAVHRCPSLLRRCPATAPRCRAPLLRRATAPHHLGANRILHARAPEPPRQSRSRPWRASPCRAAVHHARARRRLHLASHTRGSSRAPLLTAHPHRRRAELRDSRTCGRGGHDTTPQLHAAESTRVVPSSSWLRTSPRRSVSAAATRTASPSPSATTTTPR